ncbi:hypothetical protein U3A55_11480 [Salarchaeum sp. III]|uniref:hypothetical protein n=1 Tax=Salarchaeum sp. III TaxID=3107927 RepID=UPI002EDB2F57
MRCPSCGEDFDRLGLHWWHGTCPYPEIEPEIEEILTGLLMGDGSIPVRRSGYTSLIHVPMTNRTFLEWLDDRLGILSTGVSLKKTASELASNNRQTGFSPTAREENYHDMYTLWSRTHPIFDEMRETWYPDGGKRFPGRLELTPTVAKFWYLCDGYLDFGSWGRPRLGIKARNEKERGEFLESLFDTFDISPKYRRHELRFSCDDTELLIEWMGEAPPGFEYKWELDSKAEYQRLKKRAYEVHATQTLS